MRVDTFARKCLMSDTGEVLKNCWNQHFRGISFKMVYISINCCTSELQYIVINKLISAPIRFLQSDHRAFANDPTFDHKINVGHCDLYFMIQWFCLIFWRLFKGWTSHFGIMSQYNPTFHLKLLVGHCDLFFHVLLFLPYMKTDVWALYFVMRSQCDATFGLKQSRLQWPIFFTRTWLHCWPTLHHWPDE